MSDLRIIGIGNPLMGDDGIGIAAVERLRLLELPAGVEVIDGGTGGLTLLALMEGAQRVILVDAVDMGRAPGSIARFGLDDLLPADPETSFSLHASGALPALQLGRELGLLPPLSLLGVQPTEIGPGMLLSAVIASSLDPLLLILLAEIHQCAGK
ncbi:hydrogenase maturation protease [Trichloromonas sp.]|uniref:hydrogenase maturation protease n=1 Tax=Trichloromonas sp. TaxID=3069249 RepID=UPI003D817712